MSTKIKERTARVLSSILTFALASSLLVVGVNAAENENSNMSPPAIAMSVNVKADASSASIKEDLEAYLKSEDSTITAVTWPDDISFNENVTVTVQHGSSDTTMLTFTPVQIEPSGIALEKPALSSISATNTQNENKTSLLAYVNSNLTLVSAGSAEYDAAYGDAPALGNAPEFTWAQSNKDYDTFGSTYIFRQDYMFEGTIYILERTVIVSSTSYDIDSVSINYNDNTVTTTADMKWALSKNASKWNNCTENMAIRSNWYDDVVYFKIAADEYADESEIKSLYIPEKAAKPTEKPELVSSTHSITVTNCQDFDNVEYSIDKESWKTTSGSSISFTGLSSGKSYTVYVRTRYDKGEYLASDSVTAKISTKTPVETSTTIETDTDDDDAVIHALITVEPEISSNKLSGSLESSNLTKLNNAFNTYNKRYDDVDVDMVIEHYKEDDDYTSILSSSFTMPMSSIRNIVKSADTTIEYRSNLGRAYFSDSALSYYVSKSGNTLTVNMQQLTGISSSSGWKWLRNEFKAGDANVYKLSAGVGNSSSSDITWMLPVTLEEDETIDGLTLYYVHSDGDKTELDFTYDATLGGIMFTSDESGYFAIVHDSSISDVFPFKDVSVNHWARKYISYGYNQGLINGTSSTTFSPDMNVTRAMVVTLLARASGFNADSFTGESSFSDVNSTAWYAPYAQWAYNNGVVNTNKFRPDDTITRDEIAELLYKTLDVNNYDISFDSSSVTQYSDASQINDGYSTAVQFMRHTGIMNGVGNNKFDPTGTVTRAQMSAIVYRLDETLQNA